MYISKVQVLLQPTKAEVSIYRLYIRHVRVPRILETCYKPHNVKATKYPTWFFFTHHESLSKYYFKHKRERIRFHKGPTIWLLRWEGVMGDFRKKFLVDIWAKKFFARKYVAKKNSYTEKNIFHSVKCWEKNLTQFYVRKIILSSEPSHPYPPQNSNGRPLLKLSSSGGYILYKHQWNTRWAFARKLDIFACENNMLSSHVKISPLLRLHN